MAKYEYEFPRPSVATDCVVFGFDGMELKVLLIRRGIEPYKGMWALPGGFLRMDETAEECVMRELKEETSFEVSYIKQLGVFSDVNRDPRDRVLSVAFYSLARQMDVKGGDDAEHASWCSVQDLPHLAFDHDYILSKALQKLRRDIIFEPVGFGLLDEQFTMSQLQRLYESILGVSFDRRNFHRKMLQMGILNEVDADKGRDGAVARRRKHSKETDESSCDNGTTQEEHSNDKSVSNRGAVGRKGNKYSFNKEKYNKLKEHGIIKLEF